MPILQYHLRIPPIVWVVFIVVVYFYIYVSSFGSRFCRLDNNAHCEFWSFWPLLLVLLLGEVWMPLLLIKRVIYWLMDYNFSKSLINWKKFLPMCYLGEFIHSQIGESSSHSLFGPCGEPKRILIYHWMIKIFSFFVWLWISDMKGMRTYTLIKKFTHHKIILK